MARRRVLWRCLWGPMLSNRRLVGITLGPLGLPQAPLCRLLWPKFQATPTTKGWLEKKCACYNRVGARWGFFRSMSYFIVKLQVPSSEFQAPSSKLKCWDVIKSKLQVVAVFQAITKTAPKITQIRLHANALLFHCNLCGPKYGT